MDVDHESHALKYPLGIGGREPSTTRTGGEGERSSAGEATKARRPSPGSRGRASSLEPFFADLVINSALVLVAKHLESFGDLRGVSDLILRVQCG